jgi:hypothetical protein
MLFVAYRLDNAISVPKEHLPTEEIAILAIGQTPIKIHGKIRSAILVSLILFMLQTIMINKNTKAKTRKKPIKNAWVTGLIEVPYANGAPIAVKKKANTERGFCSAGMIPGDSGEETNFQRYIVAEKMNPSIHTGRRIRFVKLVGVCPTQKTGKRKRSQKNIPVVKVNVDKKHIKKQIIKTIVRGKPLKAVAIPTSRKQLK